LNKIKQQPNQMPNPITDNKPKTVWADDDDEEEYEVIYILSL